MRTGLSEPDRGDGRANDAGRRGERPRNLPNVAGIGVAGDASAAVPAHRDVPPWPGSGRRRGQRVHEIQAVARPFDLGWRVVDESLVGECLAGDDPFVFLRGVFLDAGGDGGVGGVEDRGVHGGPSGPLFGVVVDVPL